jgi:DNA-binding MarR family transcriptional regulator
MARAQATQGSADGCDSLAFLLSQVGAHASAMFAERLVPLELKPPHVGILQAISQSDGSSQQALGEKLGIFPSRLVGVLDELEERGLLERRNSPVDRRSHALYLTEAGRAIVEQISRIARVHEDALCTALDASERSRLAGLLARIAAEQGLTPGVHPGFRKFGNSESKSL